DEEVRRPLADFHHRHSDRCLPGDGFDGRLAASGLLDVALHLQDCFAVWRLGMAVDVELNLLQKGVELKAILCRLLPQRPRFLQEALGLVNLVGAVVVKLARIAELARQVILSFGDEGWVAAGWLAALEDALDAHRNTELRQNPDGVAAAPGRVVGTWPVPVVGLLFADELHADTAVLLLGADDVPGARRPAVFRHRPRLLLADPA